MDHPVILFDGVCNFCNSAVNFVLKQDKKSVFRFAPLQSEAGKTLLQQYNLSGHDLESFVLIDDGKVYKKASASLKVMSRLPWYWQAAQVFWLIPRFLRNGLYDVVAKNRYKWFGKREECMIPTPGMKNRFLS
jgi:predicted DCC family thiol-disulfide oxidoreductase YuxK